MANGWSWSGVTVIQNGQPIDIVDSGGGAIFGLGPVAGSLGPAQLCPGKTASDILTSGSATQRVTNGLNGLDGWITPRPSALFLRRLEQSTGWEAAPASAVWASEMFSARAKATGICPSGSVSRFGKPRTYNSGPSFITPSTTRSLPIWNGSDVQNGVGMGSITRTSVIAVPSPSQRPASQSIRSSRNAVNTEQSVLPHLPQR